MPTALGQLGEAVTVLVERRHEVDDITFDQLNFFFKNVYGIADSWNSRITEFLWDSSSNWCDPPTSHAFACQNSIDIPRASITSPHAGRVTALSPPVPPPAAHRLLAACCLSRQIAGTSASHSDAGTYIARVRSIIHIAAPPTAVLGPDDISVG